MSKICLIRISLLFGEGNHSPGKSREVALSSASELAALSGADANLECKFPIAAGQFAVSSYALQVLVRQNPDAPKHRCTI